MHQYWIWLTQRKGLSNAQKLELARQFGSARALYEAQEYSQALSPAALASLQDKDLSGASGILLACKSKGAQVLCPQDRAFPRRLLTIAEPPLVLYTKGTLPGLDTAAVGIVGTRHATAYGLMAAGKMAAQIAQEGGTVVSGAAMGIDAEAMWGALRAGGPVVGVLGCGIDRVYPAQNAELYRATEQQGCLVSEYPPGTPPSRWSFPRRNRIISALSDGVLVVEAPENSGTMITARDAVRQGRRLFVLPGHMENENCAGSNRLLSEGAQAVLSGREVLSHLQGSAVTQPQSVPGAAPKTAPRAAATAPKAAPKTAPRAAATAPKAAPQPQSPRRAVLLEELSAEEQRVVRRVMEGVCTVDQLIDDTGLPVGTVRACITMLELKDVIVCLPGRRVQMK